MEEKSTRNEIVLNRMFNGDFLHKAIGHEILNLYKSDNGNNYIYIQPYGTYHKSHYGKIGSVLMVRNIPGAGAMEVLALAVGLKDVWDPTDATPAMQWKKHKKYIKENNITYGGKSILDIFDRTKEYIQKQPVYFTMKAASVKRPNRKVYIVFDKKNEHGDYETGKFLGEDNALIVPLKDTKQDHAGTSLKQYFVKDGTNDDNYDRLKHLIEDKSIWDKEIDTIEANLNDDIPEDNFFDICGIEDYELAFSNALNYFMEKYPELVVEFAKSRSSEMNLNSFKSCREHNNIDILLENDEWVVVIENKITSNINGLKWRNGKLEHTQLDKYYKIAESLANGKNDTTERKIACFVLTPNYNDINLDEYNTKDFVCKKYYKKIYYKEIFDFLKDRHKEDCYFQEFLKGMERHTKEFHDDLYELTRNKFVKRIRQIS